jgi:large subunit ribosomal protein L29
MAKKINKLSDVKKSIVELNSVRKSLLNLRFQKATGQLEKTSQIKKSRKKIAQLLTKLNQNKELENV